MRNNLFRFTDTHVYFLTGPASQWTESPFRGRLQQGGDLYTFMCAEQYMMTSKAWLFEDMEYVSAILASKSPKEHKELGRGVKGYIDEKWQTAADDIVIRGNIYKFVQNYSLGEWLLKTENRRLVEGNPRDTIWGVGLSWDSAAIEDESKWRGKNKLGNALEIVRPLIAQLKNDKTLRIDPWTKTLVSMPSRETRNL